METSSKIQPSDDYIQNITINETFHDSLSDKTIYYFSFTHTIKYKFNSIIHEWMITKK